MARRVCHPQCTVATLWEGTHLRPWRRWIFEPLVARVVDFFSPVDGVDVLAESITRGHLGCVEGGPREVVDHSAQIIWEWKYIVAVCECLRSGNVYFVRLGGSRRD